jgi:glycosyltransferase involved in cell wall biosynthesis
MPPMPIEVEELEAPPAPTAPVTAGRRRLPRVLYALVLDPGRKFGSMEEQLVLLADAFRAEGGLFLPLFLSDPAKASFDDYRRRGVAAECLDLSRFRLGALSALRRLVRREAIDLVHWNFVAPLSNRYVWGLSLLCPGVRHWYTDHNSRFLPLAPPPTGIKRGLKSVLLRRYEAVICVSGYVQRCLEGQGCWSNLVTKTHFINTARFEPSSAVRDEVRGRLGAADRFVLLVVGQLIREKGIDVAIAALASLPAEAVRWILGEGPQHAELARQIAERGLCDRVRLLGLQSNVQPYLQAADVFLCPSMWAEAAGLVNLEAQACGLPVVASRIGGIPEYVLDGRTGLLFEPGDAEELARQVRRLIDDPQLRRTLSTAARAWALERFSPEARLPEWLDLYRNGVCR